MGGGVDGGTVRGAVNFIAYDNRHFRRPHRHFRRPPPSFPRKRESRTVLKNQPVAVPPPPDSRLRGDDGGGGPLIVIPTKAGIPNGIAKDQPTTNWAFRDSRLRGNPAAPSTVIPTKVGLPNGTEKTRPLPSRRRIPAYAGMTVGAAAPRSAHPELVEGWPDNYCQLLML